MRPRASNPYPSRDELKTSWHPVWVSSAIPMPDRMDPSYAELEEMGVWCMEHCSDDWVETWMMDDLAFWFKSKVDAFFFKMVWLR